MSKTLERIETYKRALSTLKRANDSTFRDFSNTDFFIAVAEVQLSRNTNGSVRAKIYIEENPYIAYNKTSRDIVESKRWPEQWTDDLPTGHPQKSDVDDFLEKRSPESTSLMRVTAGGAILVLKDQVGDQYVVLGQKDGWVENGQPQGWVIHPLHLVPASGISERTSQWLDPRQIVIHECFEENRIVHRDKHVVYYPEFSFKDFGADTNIFNDIGYESSKDRQVKAARWNQEPQRQLHKCGASWIPLGNDELIVEWQNHGSRTFSNILLVIDPDNGAIDVMGAVQMVLPNGVSINDIQCLDGEGRKIAPKEISTEELLADEVPYEMYNRPNFLFSLSELKRLFNGYSAKARLFWNASKPGTQFEEKIEPGDEFRCGTVTIDGHPSIKHIDGELVRLHAKPLVNPPLLKAGPSLLQTLKSPAESFNPEEYIFPKADIPTVTMLRG